MPPPHRDEPAHPADPDLVQYARGRLRARTRVAIESHLAGCGRCVGRLGPLLEGAADDPLLRRLRAAGQGRTVSDATPIVGPPPLVVPTGLSSSHRIGRPEVAYELLPGRRPTAGGTVQLAREYPGDAVVAVTFYAPDPTRGPGGRERLAALLRPLYAVEHPNLLLPRSLQLFGESWGVVSDGDDAVNFHALACARTRPAGPTLFGYFRQAAEGLAAAHAANVVHGDLTPSDILLFDGRLVRVGGFLRARLRGETPPWDASLDILALGRCLVALLTGRPHAVNTSGPNSRDQKDVAGLPPEVRRLVGLLTGEDSSDRVATMADAARALATLETPQAPPRRFWRWLRRR